MSNYLAIATVTTVLQNLLQAALDDAVSGALVTTRRPTKEDPTQGPVCNLYLYQTTPNPHWQHNDLPTRGPDGRLLQRPRIALDLHYLLTFNGDETQLQPQRMLGRAVQVLHSHPVLRTSDIEQVVSQFAASNGRGQPSHFLGTSDLAEQMETIAISPEPLSVEEISKLWSVLFQAPYMLSMAYRVATVLIEAESIGRIPLPVQRREFAFITERAPEIDSIARTDPPPGPILTGDRVSINGSRLQQDEARLLIGGVLLEAESLSDTRIIITLPSDLPAGAQTVQLVYMRQEGSQRRQRESNRIAFMLHPLVVDQAVRRGQIEVKLAAPVVEEQQARLLLNEWNPPPDRLAREYVLTLIAAETDDTLRFDPAAEGLTLEAGEYLLRVQIDGATSLPTIDPTLRQVTGPLLKIGGRR